MVRYLIRGISMETKEKQRSMIGANYKPVSEPGTVSWENFWMSKLEKHLLQVKMSLMSSGVQVNLLSGLHSIKHEDCISMCCCGDLFQVYIKLFSFKGLPEKGSFSSNDSESKVEEKNWKCYFRVLSNFWGIQKNLGCSTVYRKKTLKSIGN